MDCTHRFCSTFSIFCRVKLHKTTLKNLVKNTTPPTAEAAGGVAQKVGKFAKSE